MHSQQATFCQEVLEGKGFTDSVRVLDMGSLDINGSNRGFFTNAEYVGIDLGAGKGVDVVCKAHEYQSDEPFDVVISSEMLEHDVHFKESLQNALELLRPGGLLLFTCGGPTRGEHGTTRTSPADSPFTNSYYRNLDGQILEEIFNFDEDFETYAWEHARGDQDLYFWGIKI